MEEAPTWDTWSRPRPIGGPEWIAQRVALVLPAATVDYDTLGRLARTHCRLVREQLERSDRAIVSGAQRVGGVALQLQNDEVAVFSFPELEGAQLHALDHPLDVLSELAEISNGGPLRRALGLCGRLSLRLSRRLAPRLSLRLSRPFVVVAAASLWSAP